MFSITYSLILIDSSTGYHNLNFLHWKLQNVAEHSIWGEEELFLTGLQFLFSAT